MKTFGLFVLIPLLVLNMGLSHFRLNRAERKIEQLQYDCYDQRTRLGIVQDSASENRKDIHDTWLVVEKIAVIVTKPTPSPGHD